MMNCKHCGAGLSEGAESCPNCGTPVHVARLEPPVGSLIPPASPARTGIPKWGWLLGVVGCFVCVCPIILGAVLFPVFTQARLAAKSAVALSDAKQVSLGMQMYLNDYDEVFPPSMSTETTPTVLSAYLGEHPDPKLTAAEAGYTWNEELEGGAVSDLQNPAGTWVFHSSIPDELHRYEVGFADGSAKRLAQADLQAAEGLGHDLSDLGADVHRVWLLPKGDPSDPTAQFDLTDPTKYTFIVSSPGPDKGSSVMYVVRGPYSTANNQLWVSKGTSLTTYGRLHPGDPWEKVPDDVAGKDPERAATLDGPKHLTVDVLKEAKPVTGNKVIQVPKTP